MRVKEHQPPLTANINIFDKAIFFAGPIQGAPNWQERAVEIVTEIYDGRDNLYIFNPRRPIFPEPFDAELYNEQVAWEQEHLAIASRVGGHLFWFEAQDHSLPYPQGREYAKTTKKELAMTLGAVLFGRPIKLSIGIHSDFGEIDKYYQSTFDRLGIPVYSSLPDTCKAALSRLEI